MDTKARKRTITVVMLINICIFILTNLIFTIKYEQVDDFIIYNLYSGLDGTFNVHGVYYHPVICFVLGLFYRVVPAINWHSVFLLTMQFLCFTVIGYKLMKKHQSGVAVLLYALFASVFYTALLMLLQYTSVSALLIFTSVFLFHDMFENKKERSPVYKVLVFCLFVVGIMLRIQSILLVIPFMALIVLFRISQYADNKDQKRQLLRVVKYLGIYVAITGIVYISTKVIYDTDKVYKSFMEFHDIRAELHDINYVSYIGNQEVFDEVGWSENDHYLFYTFDYGDEKIFSKEKLKTILDYKIEKDGKYNFSTDIGSLSKQYKNEAFELHTYNSVAFFLIFVIALLTTKSERSKHLLIFITTVGMHFFFIMLGRSLHRVIIPEYIFGTILLLYYMNLNKLVSLRNTVRYCTATIMTIGLCVCSSGYKYDYGYRISDYKSIQDMINYTSSNKDNVYLYTVPALQHRYLAYNVYQMPPEASFSNLRVIGGWDMFTGNYYDFKERYDLDGFFLDLLKDNVYLIDGRVMWSGYYYENYKDHIIEAIQEHYGVSVQCIEIKEIGNLTVYKLVSDT